ncbi:MAG: TonB-dependent receptor [Flavobacteriales bacterium]|nr:TonB-dependent receptor [Flavobacteriales bacterium]
MIFKKITFTAIVLFLHFATVGQSIDSLNTLQNVEVVDTRAKQFNTGFKVDELDRTLLKSFEGSSISDVLISASNVNIKTYGPGGLSSISIRGGSSNHTAVLWNGINLQSPMNGGLNLSALPMDLLGDVSLQMGGSGALVGSGAAFGVLRLSSSSILEKKNSAFLSTSVGSFSNYRVATGTNFHINNSIFSVKAFYQDSENDFEFVNTAKFGKPTEKQTNSAFNQYGLVVDNKTLINDNLIFLASVLYSNFDKDVQTLMSDYTPSEANQVDRNLLASTIFKYSKDNLKLNFKNAYTDNKLDFTDPNSPEPESTNKSKSFISEIESDYSFDGRGDLLNSKNNFYSAINYTYETAESSGYTDNPNRNRISLIAALKSSTFSDKLKTSLSLREEVIDGDFKPLQLSFGLEFLINKKYSIRSNVASIYRVPTMNDLYWRETGFAIGNPDLKNESGLTSDFGFIQNFGNDGFNIKLDQTVFLSSIDNLIVWQPRSSDGKWEPINKSVGVSAGLELGADLSVFIGETTLGLKESYSYTNSQTSDDDGETWDMQVYIPKHNSNTTLWWGYKKIRASFLVNYYSQRNIDNAGNTLPAYSLGDFSLGYSIKLNKVKVDLLAKVNNLWDTQYQVTSGYAMPMRNYMLSAKFSIN